MSALRLRARLPLVYPAVALAAAAAGAIAIVRDVPVLAALLGAALVVAVVLGVRAATTRVVVEGGAEPTIAAGSAFGRRRVPVASVAVARRRPLPALVPLRVARWELVGPDGARPGAFLDEGLSERDVRALETELRNLGIPIDRG